jgi:hypothetical protein
LAKIPELIKEGATPLLITTSNNVFPARYSVVMIVINLSPPTRRTFTLMNGYFLLNNSKIFRVIHDAHAGVPVELPLFLRPFNQLAMVRRLSQRPGRRKFPDREKRHQQQERCHSSDYSNRSDRGASLSACADTQTGPVAGNRPRPRFRLESQIPDLRFQFCNLRFAI